MKQHFSDHNDHPLEMFSQKKHNLDGNVYTELQLENRWRRLCIRRINTLLDWKDAGRKDKCISIKEEMAETNEKLKRLRKSNPIDCNLLS